VALSASALGGAGDDHVTVAVIIETVHLATLIHDDVMDEAEIRRGRLTLAANWGNDIAVLFGDCLFAHALKLAASFPTPEICRAVASATQTVCSGELLQTQHRGDLRLTREQYFKVLEMKTAELFALSCELSACLCGAPPEVRQSLRQFGLALGTAYQVYDDCVDLFGSEAVAGKSLGTDLATGKLTLPVLLLTARTPPTGSGWWRFCEIGNPAPSATLRRCWPSMGRWPPHPTLSTSTWPRRGRRYSRCPARTDAPGCLA
jgi:octaprenyl-diphosphate synthase